jgi:DNA-directed RNA polymerase subunit RPC12/RpoP
MEIILGRDRDTSRFKATVGQQSKLFGANGSVPISVSRQHCSLEVKADGGFCVKNLNAENATYVNGVQVESKNVTVKDVVELGSDHYLLNWEYVEGLVPKIVDIRPLKKVMDNFKKEKKAIADRQKNNALLARVPIAFTMLGGLLAAIIPGPITICLTIVAFIITLYGIYKQKDDKSSEELEELQNKLMHDYSCPNCGRYLAQPYEQLELMDNCPYCRVMFKK